MLNKIYFYLILTIVRYMVYFDDIVYKFLNEKIYYNSKIIKRFNAILESLIYYSISIGINCKYSEYNLLCEHIFFEEGKITDDMFNTVYRASSYEDTYVYLNSLYALLLQKIEERVHSNFLKEKHKSD